MANKQEVVKNQFTEKGLEDYTQLVKTLIGIYNGTEKMNLPGKAMVLGFGTLNLDSKEDCLSCIKFMSFLLGKEIASEKTITVMSDGTKIEIIKLEMI